MFLATVPNILTAASEFLAEVHELLGAVLVTITVIPENLLTAVAEVLLTAIPESLVVLAACLTLIF